MLNSSNTFLEFLANIKGINIGVASSTSAVSIFPRLTLTSNIVASTLRPLVFLSKAK